MRARPLSVLLVSVLLAGCASGGGSDRPTVRRDANRISLEELETLTTGTAYDAVQRLRPAWLRARTSSFSSEASPAEVFLDQRHYGALSSLRDFDLAAVSEILYMNARDATTRFGTGYPGGVIQVILKR